MLSTIVKEIAKVILSIIIAVVYVFVIMHLYAWLEMAWMKVTNRWRNRKRRLHIELVK